MATTPFDEKTFFENFQGMEDLAQETIKNFLEHLPTLLSAVQKSIQSQNSEELEISAHSLKGALSNFYAEPARLLAWKLEELGNKKNPIQPDGDKLFQELQGELKRLTDALNVYASQRIAA